MDSCVKKYLVQHRDYTYIAYLDKEIDPLWEKAVDSVSIPGLPRDVQFYKSEWADVVAALDTIELASYLGAPKNARRGRKIGLSDERKRAVFQVIDNYIKLLDESKWYDKYYAMYVCRCIAKKHSERFYESIVVDEGQDLGNAEYKFLRAITGQSKHENDIFIVGDTHQRVYDRFPVLLRCGIEVRGRSFSLKMNYRTTDEIRQAAVALMAGVPYDDMDVDYEDYIDYRYYSLSHGDKPKIGYFNSQTDEVKFIADEIIKLKNTHVPLREICVISKKGGKTLESYRHGLSQYGIFTSEIRKDENDGYENLVRVATMDRVKGLEFRYVFVVSVNQGTIPSSQDEDIQNREKCQLYVAMSRAQKVLYITTNKYGKPSEFLKKIIPYSMVL